MRPTTSNIFHTRLAFHPSSLSARTSMHVRNRDAASKREGPLAPAVEREARSLLRGPGRS
jgi:hypothetical protein